MMQRLSRQSAGAIREDGQRNGPEDVSLEGTGGGPGDKRRKKGEQHASRSKIWAIVSGSGRGRYGGRGVVWARLASELVAVVTGRSRVVARSKSRIWQRRFRRQRFGAGGDGHLVDWLSRRPNAHRAG